MSAIARLKEFAGRDNDEDRARGWISKVKSAFLRDQAPERDRFVWRLTHGASPKLVQSVESNDTQLVEIATGRFYDPVLRSWSIRRETVLPHVETIGGNFIGIPEPSALGFAFMHMWENDQEKKVANKKI